ncbi:DUF4349 domain-containing protein [Kitasatospora sp. Root107]|uniref:DUF4349 domain-containing protein n=1 Tax=Kitasatospora sp. Root107 TaxID=1736424 RepID=UPI000710BE10|nr:DUF4349 domain-containing protein [Kitasatospora sp. Root107]KQV20570.1 hypothetical protein ASC99_21170 [Kitasatospora sp. Root107]
MTGTGYGRRRAALAVAGAATAAAVLLSGCGAGRDSGGRATAADAVAPQAQTQKMAEGAAAAAPGAGGASAAPVGTTEATAPRLIAYTAQLTLRSKELTRTLEQARTLVTAAGGYVAGEQLGGGKGGDGKTGDGGGATDARLTLKVPSAAYQQSLDRLAGLGEVLSRSSQADDLTQQVADVDSRLKTQQASVDRVRKLMAEAKTLAEVVSLESELSRREAELESLQQRQQGLAARTSLSTITLQVYAESAPVATVKETKDGFWESVGNALGGGWDVLVAIVRGLLIAIAAFAPFLLVLAPVGGLLWWLRRRAGSRPATEQEAQDPQE